jgi:hypothetical protein
MIGSFVLQVDKDGEERPKTPVTDIAAAGKIQDGDNVCDENDDDSDTAEQDAESPHLFRVSFILPRKLQAKNAPQPRPGTSITVRYGQHRK